MFAGPKSVKNTFLQKNKQITNFLRSEALFMSLFILSHVFYIMSIQESNKLINQLLIGHLLEQYTKAPLELESIKMNKAGLLRNLQLMTQN